MGIQSLKPLIEALGINICLFGKASPSLRSKTHNVESPSTMSHHEMLAGRLLLTFDRIGVLRTCGSNLF